MAPILIGSWARDVPIPRAPTAPRARSTALHFIFLVPPDRPQASRNPRPVSSCKWTADPMTCGVDGYGRLLACQLQGGLPRGLPVGLGFNRSKGIVPPSLLARMLLTTISKRFVRVQ